MIVLGYSGIANGDDYRRGYGLRFVGHDAGVALVADGKLLFAAEEERFNREKHTSEFPTQALNAALRHTGIAIEDIDCVAYPWKVDLRKFVGMNLHHGPKVPLAHAPALAFAGIRVVRDLMSPRRNARQFSAACGLPLPRCVGIGHHRCHAAMAYFLSPFDHAAVLTLDGQGEDASGSMSEWSGTKCRNIASIRAPDSIGILYGMVTDFLGMRASWDEYKVMGMAAYGDPGKFRPIFGRLVKLRPGGKFTTLRTAMVFRPGYCERMLAKWFGIPARRHGEPLEQVHFDLAAALQETTEQVVFHMLTKLRESSPSENLCLGGGVFQNSVINGKIATSGLFDRIFIPPVPGDNGAPAGAAMEAFYSLSPNARRIDSGFDAFCGPELEPDALIKSEFENLHFKNLEDPVATAADWLAQGKVLGWVQGRMEYGARALGHRSILASPLHADMRETVNARIKHREPFRPFGASVPREDAARWFEGAGDSPYMQMVHGVRAGRETDIPAVCHFGTCRIQTVTKDSDARYHSLLRAFEARTGIPILLNTSFNDADEPIICSARDACRSFSRMNLDGMVLGDDWVSKIAKCTIGSNTSNVDQGG